MNLNKIHFNIWDDYWDDGFVPSGKIQETDGYVEESDENISEAEQEEVVKLVAEFLKTLDFPGVEISAAGLYLNFRHLSHERRERLVKELENSGLSYNGVPIVFYSES